MDDKVAKQFKKGPLAQRAFLLIIFCACSLLVVANKKKSEPERSKTTPKAIVERVYYLEERVRTLSKRIERVESAVID